MSNARPPRHRSLLDPPILFAHRGARAHAPDNTIEAFELAARLGASGLESDVFVTADGHAVLDHGGTVKSKLRRRAIRSFDREHLPAHIPSVTEFYETIGTSFEVSIDIKDPDAFEPTVTAARAAGAEDRLWLCYEDFDQLVAWRQHTSARLVNSVRLKNIAEGVERRAARLGDASIEALNMRFPDWNAGLVAMVHRFGRFAFGWDAQQPREIASLIDIGCDAVYSDHVDRMVTVAQGFGTLRP